MTGTRLVDQVEKGNWSCLSEIIKKNPKLTILEMIAKWEDGCNNTHPGHPEDCTSCTIDLIRAIQEKEMQTLYRGCVTPRFDEIMDRLTIIASSTPDIKNRGLGLDRLVARSDLEALLHEFHRLSNLLKDSQ